MSCFFNVIVESALGELVTSRLFYLNQDLLPKNMILKLGLFNKL